MLWVFEKVFLKFIDNNMTQSTTPKSVNWPQTQFSDTLRTQKGKVDCD